MNRSERTRRALIWVVLPLAITTLATVIMTWPLARQMNSHAAGAGYGDAYEGIRGAWWTREALLDGQNPFRQPLLVYPDGFTSWLQWSHPFQYLPPAALALVFSPVMAFNLAMLIALILNGLAAYWLGMHLAGRNVAAALLGGLVFLAFPAMQGHVSVTHLGMLTMWPLPLFMLCLWKIAREGAGWRTAAWGGLWFALAALAYVSQPVYVMFPLVLFYGLYALIWDRARLVMRGAAWHRQPWSRLVGMLALGGALMLPFYVPLLAASGQDEVSDVLETGRIEFSTDLLGFASPSPFGPLDRLGLVPAYARDVLATNTAEGTAYLGLIAVALAGVAVIRRPAARPWLVIALGIMLFSLGPVLKWRDTPVIVRVENIESYVTLPWALFQHLPLVEATRTPGRFNLATGLAISALVSIGAGVILARLRRRALRAGLVIVLGAAILVEYQLFWPFMTTDARQPDYFRELAERDDVRAVLNIPVDNNLVAKTGLYQQTLHHKPLIAGHALRRTPQDPARLAILDRAARFGADDGMPPIPPEHALYLLSQAGADRLVIHKFYLDGADQVVDRWRDILGEPEYEDGWYAAFTVPRTPEPPPGLTLAGALSAEGWSAAVDVGPFAGAFLADAGSWYITTPHEQAGELVFRALPYRVARQVTIRLDGDLITSVWLTGDEVRLPLWLSPGYHTLGFEALDGCTDYPFALTCWDTPALSPDCAPLDPPVCISAAFEPPRWKPADRLPVALEVELEHGMRLRGYDVTLAPGQDAIAVRLFWESDRALPGSYALFAHLADPATAEPLAQFDGFPLVLTDAWRGGARWQWDVTIALPDDLPAGSYAVNVGWFRPDDHTRLAVRGDRPWAAAGIVHLAMVEIAARP